MNKGKDTIEKVRKYEMDFFLYKRYNNLYAKDKAT